MRVWKIWKPFLKRKDLIPRKKIQVYLKWKTGLAIYSKRTVRSSHCREAQRLLPRRLGFSYLGLRKSRGEGDYPCFALLSRWKAIFFTVLHGCSH
jgi:hypothetical protein